MNLASVFSRRSQRRPSPWIAALAVASTLTPTIGQTNAPAAGATNAPAAPTAVVIPQSVFDPKVRRDPFFPESTRLNPRPVVVDPGVGTGKPSKPKDVLESLRLNGITGSKRRKFAAINGITFGPQEESIIKTASGDVRVKVVEIRDRSVIVNIDGSPEPKEIFLKEE